LVAVTVADGFPMASLTLGSLSRLPKTVADGPLLTDFWPWRR